MQIPSPDFYPDWKEWARALGQNLVTANDLSLNMLWVSKDKLPLATGENRQKIIYVHDATGGAIPAYSNGTDWLRVTDASIIN